MRARHKRWVLISGLLAIILIAFLALSSRPPATGSAVAIAFLGYTNSPGNHMRFALFSVSNQAPYSVRWYGDWVEVDGVPYHKAPIANSSLAGFRRAPVLEGGRSLLMAVGEPSDEPGNGRWRFAMLFSRYTWRAWWVDQSFRGKLPLKVGPFVLVDAQRVLNQSNHVTVTTEWLTR